MSKAQYSLAEVEGMLLHCAPDAKLIFKKHHYWAVRGKKRYTNFPKGEGAGGEKPTRIRVEDGRIRACVTMLEIDVECVKKILPGVCK